MRFILVDRILSLEPGVRVLAARRVPPDEELFQDHFPGFPVLPGVLLTEMMGQAAAKALDAERRPRGKAMLAKILSASLRQWVRPGDEVLLHAEITASTDSYANAQRFTAAVDSAAVYVNASTRFTDGFEFGFGAEVGISTNRLHARGPMGLRELTTYKYVVQGSGQVRT